MSRAANALSLDFGCLLNRDTPLNDFGSQVHMNISHRAAFASLREAATWDALGMGLDSEAPDQ